MITRATSRPASGAITTGRFQLNGGRDGAGGRNGGGGGLSGGAVYAGGGGCGGGGRDSGGAANPGGGVCDGAESNKGDDIDYHGAAVTTAVAGVTASQKRV